MFGKGWQDLTPDVLVWISVVALDLEWRVSDEYVGGGGAGSLHGGRYVKFGQWVAEARFVDVPVLCLDECGVPSFTDGRHRFAWLLDHDLRALPIEVPPDQADVFGARFGTAVRIGSIL